jgi:hypothetical protein
VFEAIMKKPSAVLALVIILLAILIAFLITLTYFQGLPHKQLPLISIDKDIQDVNVTQGMSLAVNLTITSKTDKELSIPLDLSLFIIRNSSGWQGLPEETVFTYTFNPDSLNLEPYGSNSSLLTIVLSEDAPIGEYQFSVETGNSEETHVSGTAIQIDVNPK